MERSEPQRTCIACRRKTAKGAFVRLCRSPDGFIDVDPTGKRPGRGAYICASEKCVERAMNVRNLTRTLRLTEPERPLDIDTIKGEALSLIKQIQDESSARSDGHDGRIEV